MDDVEQLKLLLKKYLTVEISTESSTRGYTKLTVDIKFDGQDITKDCVMIKEGK